MRTPEPAVRLLLIPSHILSGEIQLAQGVLSILVTLLSGIGQILYRLGYILRDIRSFQIHLAQPVGGVGIALRRGFLIPGHCLLHSIFDFAAVYQGRIGKSHDPL